jgi:long-chain acyl-CoA synthetase
MRKLTKTIHVIPIDPATQLINAMQASAYVLHHNKTICIFPEGGRSLDGTVQEFKKGVGILGQEMKVRLVPVFIKGTFAAWPRGQKFPHPRSVSIAFGKPYNIDELKTIGKNSGVLDDYGAIATGIREKVIELQNK